MRTSGLFQTTRWRKKIKSLKEKLYLCFISDVHWMHDGFSHKAWEDTKAWHRENGANTIYFFGGDYLEWANARTRSAVEAVVQDSFRGQLDRWVQPDLRQFAEEAKFVIGNLIGVSEGNHGWKFEDGTIDSQVLAGLLQAPFLGVSSVSQVTLEYNGRFAAFNIYFHHGQPSNSKTTGGPINTVEKMIRNIDHCLIYAQGDNHQRWAVPTDPRMLPTVNGKTGKLEMREITPWLVRTGGYVKNFEPGVKSWLVDKGAGARSLGPMIVELQPCMQSKNTAEVLVRSAIYI